MSGESVIHRSPDLGVFLSALDAPGGPTRCRPPGSTFLPTDIRPSTCVGNLTGKGLQFKASTLILRTNPVLSGFKTESDMKNSLSGIPTSPDLLAGGVTRWFNFSLATK